MEWPQITWIVASALGLLITSAWHGKQRDEEYNIFTSIIIKGIWFFILYSGGFFN